MRTFPTGPAPHWPAPTSVQRVMRDVLVALVPGIALHVFFFGPAILMQIVLALVFALGVEAATLRARGRPSRPFLDDLSAPVTAVLFALCIPPLSPWWVSLCGMVVAIGLAKHAYGGLGRNVFNPAMAGYAIVLVAFPLDMTRWLAPASLAAVPVDFAAALHAIFAGRLPPALGWDTIAQATPLDIVRTLASKDLMIGEIRSNPVFGDFGGKGWEWIANAYALGGLYLLWRRVIHWHVPVAVIASVVVLSVPFWLADADRHPFPLQHVFSGGLVLAAFFIATDPVTGCSTPHGRLVFGAGVGVLTLVIRRWGAYPDGVAFAVLIMNCAAPLIDRYTRPRVFGHGRHA
jgi:electron transport complex protein RnfD